MGRLFWKFFLFIALAQLGGIVAVAIVFWLTEPRFDQVLESVDAGPSARTNVSAAAAILRFGGTPAFKAWAASDAQQPIFAVDASGKDLLDRTMAPGIMAQARKLHEVDPDSPLVAEVSGADGRYLLFAARAAGRGPAGERGEPPSLGARRGEGPPPPAEGPPLGDAPPPGPPPGAPPFAPPDGRVADGGPPGLHQGPRSRIWPHRGPIGAARLASLFTAALLAWYVAKPIRSLRLAFQAASGGRLDHRVAPVIGGRQDELADLGKEFDRMAERLEDSMSRQTRLLHDVSHEVRSPLARLHAAVGLLRQKRSSEESTVERIEEEIARIDRLVGDLLKLSRIEAGDLAEEIEEVDLRELVSQIVSDAEFEARSSGRRMSWAEQTSAMLLGRPEMLHVAFENIVRNAIKHAPQSEVVTIETSVDGAGTRYSFLVLDAGPGVPEEELATLFTPFYRSAHAARTDGYGLGLAIAKRSIEAHGGTIRAKNRPSGGLAVEITLPLAGG